MRFDGNHESPAVGKSKSIAYDHREKFKFSRSIKKQCCTKLGGYVVAQCTAAFYGRKLLNNIPSLEMISKRIND